MNLIINPNKIRFKKKRYFLLAHIVDGGMVTWCVKKSMLLLGRLAHIASVEKKITQTKIKMSHGIDILCMVRRGALPLPLRHTMHYLLPINNLLEQSPCTFCCTGSTVAENISPHNVTSWDISGKEQVLSLVPSCGFSFLSQRSKMDRTQNEAKLKINIAAHKLASLLRWSLWALSYNPYLIFLSPCFQRDFTSHLHERNLAHLLGTIILVFLVSL